MKAIKIRAQALFLAFSLLPSYFRRCFSFPSPSLTPPVVSFHYPRPIFSPFIPSATPIRPRRARTARSRPPRFSFRFLRRFFFSTPRLFFLLLSLTHPPTLSFCLSLSLGLHDTVSSRDAPPPLCVRDTCCNGKPPDPRAAR